MIPLQIKSGISLDISFFYICYWRAHIPNTSSFSSTHYHFLSPYFSNLWSWPLPKLEMRHFWVWVLCILLTLYALMSYREGLEIAAELKSQVEELRRKEEEVNYFMNVTLQCSPDHGICSKLPLCNFLVLFYSLLKYK